MPPDDKRQRVGGCPADHDRLRRMQTGVGESIVMRHATNHEGASTERECAGITEPPDPSGRPRHAGIAMHRGLLEPVRGGAVKRQREQRGTREARGGHSIAMGKPDRHRVRRRPGMRGGRRYERFEFLRRSRRRAEQQRGQNRQAKAMHGVLSGGSGASKYRRRRGFHRRRLSSPHVLHLTF